MTSTGIDYVRRGPKKLTREIIAELVRHLVSGAPLKYCAEAIGVSGQSIAEWMARGTDPAEKEPLYSEFAESVARARAQWAVGRAASISAGRKGWSGAAWMLERFDREAFGPPLKRLEHSGPGSGGAIRIVASSVEIPAEIPDDHPSVIAAATVAPIVDRAVKPVNGHANGNGHAPARAPIGFLPIKDDPEE